MPAVLIEPTDVIDVKFIPLVIFGPPGSGKTSLAQTAEEPFTFDFDVGVHRSFNRRTTVRFESWQDVTDLIRDATGQGDGRTSREVVARFLRCRTVVVDTLGRMLDSLIPVVQRESGKYAGPGGAGLSPQGYGVLGSRFAHWIKAIRDMGKDLVMLCHEEESREGESVRVGPDMPGKMSWKEVHKWADLIGRLRYEGSRRILDFNPSETAVCCKNMAGWGPITVGRLEDRPTFLADLLLDAKTRAGRTAEASAAQAAAVKEWDDWVRGGPSLAEFNARLPEIAGLSPQAKRQVWNLLESHARNFLECVWDAKTKTFVAKPIRDAEPQEREVPT